MEEGAHTVDWRLILNWWKSSKSDTALSVINYLTVGIGGSEQSREKWLRSVNRIVNISKNKLGIETLEGNSPQNGLWSRKRLKIISDTIVGDNVIGQRYAIDFEYENLLKSCLVLLSVSSTKCHHYIEILIIVVVYFICEGVCQARLTPHWIHFEIIYSEYGRSRSIARCYQLEVDCEGGVARYEFNGLKGKEVSCVIAIAANLVTKLWVIFAEEKQIVEVDV